MITAEIIPIGEKNAVALALQRQGFRIISIRETITIGGERKIFEKFFKMNMKMCSKNVLSGVPTPTMVEFYKPLTAPVIPDKFRELIKEVLFPEPPEFF